VKLSYFKQKNSVGPERYTIQKYTPEDSTKYVCTVYSEAEAIAICEGVLPAPGAKNDMPLINPSSILWGPRITDAEIRAKPHLYLA